MLNIHHNLRVKWNNIFFILLEIILPNITVIIHQVNELLRIVNDLQNVGVVLNNMGGGIGTIFNHYYCGAVYFIYQTVVFSPFILDL